MEPFREPKLEGELGGVWKENLELPELLAKSLMICIKKSFNFFALFLI